MIVLADRVNTYVEYPNIESKYSVLCVLYPIAGEQTTAVLHNKFPYSHSLPVHADTPTFWSCARGSYVLYRYGCDNFAAFSSVLVMNSQLTFAQTILFTAACSGHDLCRSRLPPTLFSNGCDWLSNISGPRPRVEMSPS